MTLPRGGGGQSVEKPTFAEFMRHFVRVPDDRTGRVGPIQPHREQQRLIAAVDAIDPATGLRRFREFALSWPRKLGKSTTDAALGLWALTSDPFASDREVAILSSDLAQSRDSVFLHVRRIVSRHPWLKKHVRLLATEAVFKDDSGEHVLRVLPRDSRGLHGLNLSCLISDETWVHDSWDLLEGVSPSPSRVAPITVWSSYAGLRSQRRPSVPWFDVLSRARAGDDPQVFCSHVEGREQVIGLVPWLNAAWLDRMERQFSAVPSKARRLALNIWPTGADSDSFLTDDEIRDAIDPHHVEPVGPDPGCRYVLGIDVGVTHDRCAIALTHIDPRGKLVVDALRYWSGSRAKPVDLPLVESVLEDLATRFKAPIHGDSWQFTLMGQRLQKRGLRVVTHTVEVARLDSYATIAKTAFRDRLIVIPPDPTLREELENLVGEEMRRRDKVRFTSGPGAHDDGLMAIMLSTESAISWREHGGQLRVYHTELGRKRMAAIDHCRAGMLHRCPLITDPSAHAGCGRCAAYVSASEARDAHVRAGGEWQPLPLFTSEHLYDCDLIREARMQAVLSSLCL